MDLDLGLSEVLAARIVDGEGVALAHWEVGLVLASARGETFQLRITDEDGRVRFGMLRDQSALLDVYGPHDSLRRPALHSRSDLRPGPQEHEVVVELAHAEPCVIMGQIATPGWKPSESLVITYGEPQTGRGATCPVGTLGEPFAIERVSPGRVAVNLRGESGILRPLGRFELAPGEMLDLGLITLDPPGSIRFVSDGPGALASGIRSVRFGARESRSGGVAVYEVQASLEQPILTLPGEYSLNVILEDGEVIARPFRVRSGEVTEVDVGR
jgi:hypothetical protein